MARRIFILLILCWLAFVVYRYIDPQGADKVIEKVNTTRHSWFPTSEMVWTWVIENTWNFLVEEDTGIVVDTGTLPNSWELVETDEWLKDLQNEIAIMLETGGESTGIVQPQTVAPQPTVVSEPEIVAQPTVVQPSVQSPVVAQPKPTSTSTSSKWLTNKDYQDTQDIFNVFIQ